MASLSRRRLLAAAGALVLPGWALAETRRGPALTASAEIAPLPGQGHVRVALRFAAPVAWRLAAIEEPPALWLELPPGAWRGPRLVHGHGVVRDVRADVLHGRRGTRITIALQGPVAVPQVRPDGLGLVLDLRPGPAAGFARMARAGTIASARPAAPTPLPVVVLDPGHGGKDPGATGANGTLEKRLTLLMALELKRQLESAGRCRVLLTRQRDVFVPLGARVEFARRHQAALFLSLHADSAPPGQHAARGASVYTLAEQASDPLAAAIARSENLADKAGGLRLPSVPPEVQAILLSLIRQETRQGSERVARLAVSALETEVPLLPNSHRRASFVVLKAPEIPAALVELGFLSHPADESALNQPGHRARLAGALTRAVHGYLAPQAVAAGG